jgi:hypothetical protein
MAQQLGQIDEVKVNTLGGSTVTVKLKVVGLPKPSGPVQAATAPAPEPVNDLDAE